MSHPGASAPDLVTTVRIRPNLSTTPRPSATCPGTARGHSGAASTPPHRRTCGWSRRTTADTTSAFDDGRRSGVARRHNDLEEAGLPGAPLAMPHDGRVGCEPTNADVIGACDGGRPVGSGRWSALRPGRRSARRPEGGRRVGLGDAGLPGADRPAWESEGSAATLGRIRWWWFSGGRAVRGLSAVAASARGRQAERVPRTAGRSG